LKAFLRIVIILDNSPAARFLQKTMARKNCAGVVEFGRERRDGKKKKLTRFSSQLLTG